MKTSTEKYKYFAFISYNSKDQEWGKRIQRKLENYSMPSTLCSEHGWARKPMKPIFFAPTDIQPGGLSEELQKRLTASGNLIVICSPNSAGSDWVGWEIEFFHKLGRTKNIHFFIVDGIPNSKDPKTACFHPIVQELGLSEILGVNVHEKVYRYPWQNRERAYVQLITKMLGVEFDSIWKRHKRRKMEQVIVVCSIFIAVVAALLGVWWTNKAVDVRVQAVEASIHNDQLPAMKDAIITLALDNETKADTIAAFTDEALFANIPSRFINQQVRLQVDCRDFIPLDTMLTLEKDIQLNLYRDPMVYGNVSFRLWSIAKEEVMSNVELTVAGQKVVSDANGRVRLSIPLDIQKTSYEVVAISPAIQDAIAVPCGEDDVLVVDE